MKKSKSLPLLFCHEGGEPIAHGHYFVKSDRSDSLTVALLSRTMRTNRVHRFLKRGTEQRAKGAIRSWAYKRGKIVKNIKKYEFVKPIASFLQAIRSNHERITHIALL